MKKYRRLLWSAALLCLLLVGGILYLFHTSSQAPKEKETYREDRTSASQIQVFGDNQAYVAFKGDAQVSQNYVITEERRYLANRKERLKQTKETYWRLNLYDLRRPDLKKKTLDLLKLVRDRFPNLAPFSWEPVSYEGRDYIYVLYKNQEDKTTKSGRAFLDLETEEFRKPPKGYDWKVYLEYLDFSVAYATDFSKTLDQYQAMNVSWKVNMTLPSSGDLRAINFVQDYPKIVQGFDQGAYHRVYPRKGLVTPERLFQDLRHWFAPIGQDKLDVIAINPNTGEGTAINTLEEYRAWSDANAPK